MRTAKFFNGKYEVNELGEVYCFTNNRGNPLPNGQRRLLKGNVQRKGKGYRMLHLKVNKVYYNIFIHRLVAQKFIPNPLNKPTVNHKDLNKLNNHVDNLEWVTGDENNQHAYLHGRFGCGGERIKLSKEKAKEIVTGKQWVY